VIKIPGGRLSYSRTGKSKLNTGDELKLSPVLKKKGNGKKREPTLKSGAFGA